MHRPPLIADLFSASETGYRRIDLKRRTDKLIAFFRELKRRKIWWVAGVYLAASWIVVQVVAMMEGTFSLPSWLDMVTVTLLVAGFPLALILAWAQETQAVDKGDPRSRGPVRDSGASIDISPQNDDLNSLSIAVLPFDNFTDDDSYASLADGISEDITAHLTFQSFFRVKARNSSFQYKGTSLDITAVGKQLNVNFVLEGSIRIVGDKLRITSQLIEVQTGIHVWSDRVDEPLSEIGRTQDAVTQQIADIVSDWMLRHLRKQYADKPEKELGALGLALRADGIQVTDVKSRDRKRALMQRAVDKAPGIQEFRAILNNIIANDYSNLFSDDPAAERKEIIRQAEVLLHRAPQNPVVLLLTAQSYSITGKFEQAVQLARQADAIAPRRESRLVLANTTWRAGLIDEAIEILEELQVSARAGDNGPLEVLTGVQVCKGDLESALRSSDLEVLHQGDVFLTWLLRANILAALGRMDEARECINRVRALLPRFTLEGAIIGFKRNHATQESQNRMTEGLRLLIEDEAGSRE